MIYVTTISFLLALIAWIIAFAANRRIDELQRKHGEHPASTARTTPQEGEPMSHHEELKALRAEVAELRKEIAAMAEALPAIQYGGPPVQFANPQRSNAPSYVITGGRVVASTGSPK